MVSVLRLIYRSEGHVSVQIRVLTAPISASPREHHVVTRTLHLCISPSAQCGSALSGTLWKRAGGSGVLRTVSDKA